MKLGETIGRLMDKHSGKMAAGAMALATGACVMAFKHRIELDHEVRQEGAKIYGLEKKFQTDPKLVQVIYNTSEGVYRMLGGPLEERKVGQNGYEYCGEDETNPEKEICYSVAGKIYEGRHIANNGDFQVAIETNTYRGLFTLDLGNGEKITFHEPKLSSAE